MESYQIECDCMLNALEIYRSFSHLFFEPRGLPSPVGHIAPFTRLWACAANARLTMGNSSSFSRITALLVLLHLSCAIPWAGPAPTPTGLMPEVGISLLPTEAPGLNGVPKELLRRMEVPFPPPLNWCGFLDGNPSAYNLCCRIAD